MEADELKNAVQEIAAANAFYELNKSPDNLKKLSDAIKTADLVVDMEGLDG